jgi:hypothetical protein
VYASSSDPDDPVPEEVRRLLAANVADFECLEVLLLFVRHPDDHDSVETAAATLGAFVRDARGDRRDAPRRRGDVRADSCGRR